MPEKKTWTPTDVGALLYFTPFNQMSLRTLSRKVNAHRDKKAWNHLLADIAVNYKDTFVIYRVTNHNNRKIVMIRLLNPTTKEQNDAS